MLSFALELVQIVDFAEFLSSPLFARILCKRLTRLEK